jgi:hypothetical protein
MALAILLVGFGMDNSAFARTWISSDGFYRVTFMDLACFGPRCRSRFISDVFGRPRRRAQERHRFSRPDHIPC